MMETGNDTVPVVRLADPTFQFASHLDSILLIHVNTGNLSYAILNSVSNTVVAFCSQPLAGDDPLAEAANTLYNDAWLQERVAKVRLVVQPDDYVLIPKDLFDPREIATYLKFHSFREPGGSLLFDRMDALGMVGVYHLPHHGVETFGKLFPNLSVWATPTPFIQLATREHKTEKCDFLFALFTPGSMYLAAINQGRLVFGNSFEIATKEDVSYYSLAVCEQLHLSPEKVGVVAWGSETAFDEQYATLKYYFRNVQRGERPLALKFTDSLSSKPVFAEYPLFAAGLCE